MADLNAESLPIEDIIAEHGEYISSTSGTSMYPMLRHRRDTIVIERITRPLKKHDVPLYRLKSGKLVLHRILKVLPNGQYVIRGDNLFAKEYVSEDQIIGVLREFFRKGKHYVCATDRRYKCYIFWIRASYPIRFLWKTKIRPILAKIKHKLLK